MFHVDALTTCCLYLIGSFVQTIGGSTVRFPTQGKLDGVSVKSLFEDKVNRQVAGKVRGSDTGMKFIQLNYSRESFHILSKQFTYL